MIYTVEVVEEYEEDFGGFQYHWELRGVFSSQEEAERFVEEIGRFGDESRIKEWDLN